MPATQAARELVVAEQAVEAMLERHGQLPTGEGPEIRRAQRRWIARLLDLERRYLVEDEIAAGRVARAQSEPAPHNDVGGVIGPAHGTPGNDAQKETDHGRRMGHAGAGAA